MSGKKVNYGEKGSKGFQKKRSSLTLGQQSVLQCAWCGRKEIYKDNKRIYEKIEITDETALKDLKELRPEFPGDRFFLHKHCKSLFEFQREYPLCNGCRHRKTLSTTKAIRVVDLCQPETTYYHRECWEACSVKNNYKGRPISKKSFMPDPEEGYSIFAN